MSSTYTPTAERVESERRWHLVDAEGVVLGRLASEVARVLQGKDKPWYAPHIDTGDFVVVVNAERVRLTGDKLNQKKYYRHSGYTGGLKERTAKEMLERFPDRLIRHAVSGMLPKNRLARRMLSKLKVYAGPEHPHTAQSPQPLELNV